MWFVNGFMWRRVRLWEMLAGEMALAIRAGCGWAGRQQLSGESGGEGLLPPAPHLTGKSGLKASYSSSCTSPCSNCTPLYSPSLQLTQHGGHSLGWGQHGGVSLGVGKVSQLLEAGPDWWALGRCWVFLRSMR